MANPQKENGHTDIANEIMEAMARTHWSGYEIQIILFLLRKTYGWHKKEDWISLSSFEKATAIDHTSICRTIKKLINRKIIKKDKKKMSFNKDYDEWEGVAKSPLAKSSMGGGEIVNKGVAKSPLTKEIKETIQKKADFSFLKDNKKTKPRRSSCLNPIQKINDKVIIDGQGFIKRLDHNPNKVSKIYGKQS
jgi:phage replication O-like protein O